MNPVARDGRLSSLHRQLVSSPFTASELRLRAKESLVEIVTALLLLIAAEFIEVDLLYFDTLQWTFSLSTRPFLPQRFTGNASAA